VAQQVIPGLLGEALIVLLLIVVLSRIKKLRNEMKSSAWQMLQAELARGKRGKRDEGQTS
jgi:hypothetical protein